jgi:hypothetical protein
MSENIDRAAAGQLRHELRDFFDDTMLWRDPCIRFASLFAIAYLGAVITSVQADQVRRQERDDLGDHSVVADGRLAPARVRAEWEYVPDGS